MGTIRAVCKRTEPSRIVLYRNLYEPPENDPMKNALLMAMERFGGKTEDYSLYTFSNPEDEETIGIIGALEKPEQYVCRGIFNETGEMTGIIVEEIPPVLITLGEAKTAKRAELMAARDQFLAAGFDWQGHHYPLSPELSGDMIIKLTAMQMLPPPPEYIYQWKDASGIYRDIGNADAFKVFCAGALSHGEALFARERMLQELVEAATTVKAVEAITWNIVPTHG